MENKVFISDDVAELKKKIAQGVPTIAVETKENKEAIASLSPKPNAIHVGWDDMDEDWVEKIRQRAYGIPWTIFETERTVARELSESDIDALFELYAGPRITDYIEPLFEYEAEKEYQANYRKYIYEIWGFGLWGIFDKKTGRLIGRAGIDPRDGRIELGYVIASDRQGQGIGYEVCKKILEYAADDLEIEELYCTIFPQNESSKKLAEKLGFVPTSECTDDGKLVYSKNLQKTRLEMG